MPCAYDLQTLPGQTSTRTHPSAITMKIAELLTVLFLVFTEAISAKAQTASGLVWSGHVSLSGKKSSPAIVMVLRAERKPETPITARYPHLPRRTESDLKGDFKFELL